MCVIWLLFFFYSHSTIFCPAFNYYMYQELVIANFQHFSMLRNKCTCLHLNSTYRLGPQAVLWHADRHFAMAFVRTGLCIPVPCSCPTSPIVWPLIRQDS